MKYVKFNGFIAVPDDFEWDDESRAAKWIRDYLENAEGLCKYDPETGCNPEHHIGMTVLTEEQFFDSFED